MSAPVPGPQSSPSGEYLWTCHVETCRHTGPLDVYYKAEADDKDYACPRCGTRPQVPLIELHNRKTNKLEVFFMPTPKQVEAMLCTASNLLYGGRAGTGKSWWLRN